MQLRPWGGRFGEKDMMNKELILNIDTPNQTGECEDTEYRGFVLRVGDLIRERVDEGYSVCCSKVIKNNSVELDSVSIRENGRNIAPNFYLNMFYPAYQDGTSEEDIADEIIRLYHECMEGMRDDIIEPFTYENMKDRIIFRAVNYDANKEYLCDVPHFRYKDLALTFCCLLSLDGQGMGTVKITDEHIETWGVTREDLYLAAAQNSPKLLPHSFENIFKLLAKLMLKELEQEPANIDRELFTNIIENLQEDEENRYAHSMYVLTTDSGINGASCVFYDGVLESIYEQFGCGFYILPSSVNEVILIPDKCAGEGEEEHLSELVKGVNRSEVPRQEVLSDKVYHYPEDNFRLA